MASIYFRSGLQSLLNRSASKSLLGLLLFLLFWPVSSCTKDGEPKIQRYFVQNDAVWLDQNWSSDQRNWYHHETQGTLTFPLPFEWFVNLEQPGLLRKGRLIEPEYMAQFGFIPGTVNPYNQANLPVGLAVDYQVTHPATGKTFNAIGLTCAACHTGSITYENTNIRIDGAPAMVNLPKFGITLIKAMLETYLLPARFKRFASGVLGTENTPKNREILKKEFEHTLFQMIDNAIIPIEYQLKASVRADLEKGKGVMTIFEDLKKTLETNLDSSESFGRLDALTRIGNQVFSEDAGRAENYVPPFAPVNYPQLWSVSWFEWVQYDGSIMQPMVRNTGEALGVAAGLQIKAGTPNQFASTVPLDHLYQMEQLLAGSPEPYQTKSFNGLRAPKWPEHILGRIDRVKAKKGEKLYRELCQTCHLPPVHTDEFWTDQVWKQSYYSTATPKQWLLDLTMVGIDKIGTDPNQALILAERKVNTDNLGIDTSVYLQHKADTPCEKAAVKSGPSVSYAASLGTVVQLTNEFWYNHQKPPVAAEMRNRMNGERINCLRALKAYKARPLNGIWATAPFLHNGAVPDLLALLSPVAERPTTFYIGNLEFDPVRVGFLTVKKEGLFLLDTKKKGNSNQGHEFTNDRTRKGVIGRLLRMDERQALVEFLKTL